MKLSTLLLLCFFFIYPGTSLPGQNRFECTGEVLIATSDGKTTSIFRPRSIPFAKPFLSILGSYDGSFDALGFNPKDNFVYGVEQNTNNIVRLSLFNDVEIIGKVTLVDTLKSNAGDCTAEGLYVCHDYALNKMLVFDVSDGFKLLRQIDLFWDPSSPNKGAFKTRLFDFAFDPNNTKTAYSYQGNFEHEELAPKTTRGSMLRINLNFDDPNLGMVTPLARVNDQEVTHIAGLAFSPQSSLFGYGSKSEGLNPLQNDLFGINAFQGQISPVLTNNPAQVTSDACSCPFSLTFTNSAPTDGMFCNNDTKTFIVGFENNSYISLNDVVLKDTFPEGTIIKSISKTFSGKIDAGTGVGTNILSVSGLLIPAKEKLTISIELSSINAKDGPTYNRAYLHNLPPRFPSMVASDDPNSSTSGDQSNFFFTTRGIKQILWKTISPTDCIVPNDGRIVVSSKEFVKGQGFEVSLRNMIGWKETITNVVIDENNSFTIDSLFPGDYQLFRLRSLNDNCSLSLKDTTIILEAPHEKLNLQVSGNTPVCEGATLLLKSWISPSGSISWTGPEIFGSDDSNPVIRNATPDKTGIYEAVALNGYCKQKKMLQIEVKKQIKTIISGNTNYCIRDTLRLAAKTNEKEIKHDWFGPVDLTEKDSLLQFPITGDTQSGYYEVISTNGACFDTVGIDVKVLPTPALTLDEMIVTDFCNPLILNPILTGDSDVIYQWLPEDGLSCADCPNPQIQPVVNPTYQLKVENNYNCTDSTTVRIVLNKDKLVFTPNVFFPEGSSENNHFRFIPNCVVRYVHHLTIYDRFGNQVFHSKGIGPDGNIENWDGLISGKRASQGVYIWYSKVELVDGTISFLTGDVTVL